MLLGVGIVPRTARKKSQTGIYHVMLRGINQQQIFEDSEDYEKFLEVLEASKSASCFELYAYCLMGNHLHLLLKTLIEDMDQIFKRIGARYVYWYNWKYRRTGHLFQDRFKSECVEDDKYFLTVLRYIHQNPVKANLCDAIEEYRWSSYHEYLGNSKLVDTRFPLELIGLDEFIRYSNSTNNDCCLEYAEKTFRLTDAEAKAIMREVCECDTVEAFQKLGLQGRDASIMKLSAKGVSIRQINRLTGVSKGLVEKVLRS
jgi:REP element-mobilizing transposase RayT